VRALRQAIARGTFDWETYFPGSTQAKALQPAHSFGAWCDLWLETKGRLAKKTLTQYGNALKVWKELLGADTPMEKLPHAVVAAKVGKTPWASASFLFHHAEKFNRQVTFVAAYRLAREAGADPKNAYQQAVQATYDGHFDYSANNRPRVMQDTAL